MLHKANPSSHLFHFQYWWQNIKWLSVNFANTGDESEAILLTSRHCDVPLPGVFCNVNLVTGCKRTKIRELLAILRHVVRCFACGAGRRTIYIVFWFAVMGRQESRDHGRESSPSAYDRRSVFTFQSESLLSLAELAWLLFITLLESTSGAWKISHYAGPEQRSLH